MSSFLAAFVIFAAAARDGACIDERAVTTGQTGKGDTPDPEPEPTPEPTPEPDEDSSAS